MTVLKDPPHAEFVALGAINFTIADIDGGTQLSNIAQGFGYAILPTFVDVRER